MITQSTSNNLDYYFSNSLAQHGNAVEIDVCLLQGFLLAITTYRDTFKLAPLAAGTYSIRYGVHYSGSIDLCDPISSHYEELSFNVRLASPTSGKLVKRIFDPTGRETDDKPNTILLYQFEDGTVERVYRME